MLEIYIGYSNTSVPQNTLNRKSEKCIVHCPLGMRSPELLQHCLAEWQLMVHNC